MAEPRRVAFLGIGHPLRRDDAAGVEVCERMRPLLRGQDDVLVVSGGSAPENCVGALRAFGPDLVIVIDAARMGQPPGTLLRIDPSDPRVAGASTHTLPLPTFCEYVAETLGCEVTLLGIEPADTSFGEGLTPAVERAVERAVKDALAQLDEGWERELATDEAAARLTETGFGPPFKNRHSREGGNLELHEPGPPPPLRDAKRYPRGRRNSDEALSPRTSRSAGEGGGGSKGRCLAGGGKERSQ